MGLRDPIFLGHFGLQISKNSGLWSFSQNISTGFVSLFVYLSIWATFRGVLNIGPIGPISTVNLGPKLKHDSGL